MSWLVYILLLGCSPSVPPTPPDPRTLRVGGCAGWVDGGCLRADDRPLAVWADREFTARSGAASVRARWEPEVDGYVATVEAPASELVVERGTERSVIPLRAEVVSPTLAAARDTKAPAWEGRAQELLEHADPLTRAEIFSELAHRADLARDLPLGASYAAEARAALVEAGRLDLWPHVAFRYAARRVSVERWLPEVRAQIDDARRHLTPWWDDWAYLAFVEARLLRREGDVRRSASLAREAAGAFRWIDPRMVEPSRAELAEVARRSGRHGDALLAFADIYLAAPEDACTRGLRLGNYGLALDDAARAGFDARTLADLRVQQAGTDPVDVHARSLDLVWAHCGRVEALVAMENWLLARLEAGAPAATIAPVLPLLRALIYDRGPGTEDQRLVLDLERIEARVMLGEGRPADALAALLRAEQAATYVDRGEGLLEVTAAQAEALTVLGRHEDALQRYRRAHEIAGVVSTLVALGGGRDTFLAAWQREARGWVALLVRLGRTAEALDVARELRAAMLDGLVRSRRLAHDDPETVGRREALLRAYADLRARQEEVERGAWALRPSERSTHAARVEAWREEVRAAVDGLLSGPWSTERTPRRAPAPGEVFLSWFPVDGGTLVFVARAEGVEVLGPLTGPVAESLAPLRARVAGARQIVMLPSGVLREEDLHWQRAAGPALLDLAPVVWSLDLGITPSRGGEGALVASDARGDLPWARWEGDRVVDSLTASGLAVRALRGAAVTREQLQGGIAQVRLLHVAGHGQAGADTLEAELMLADDAALTVADVLSASSAPARVVLSGCETGRTLQTDVETLGLGQAFVVAGAGAVVASVRPVDDEVAAAWMAALYAAGFATQDPAQAFRAASLAVSWVAPEADVGAFRLLVP